MVEHRVITIQVGPRGQLGRGRSVLQPQKIEAEVLGRWAVHLTWDSAGGQDYSVTHVPSGLVLADRMTKKQAVDLARGCSLSLDIDHVDRDKHLEVARFEVGKVGGRMLFASSGAVSRG